MPAIEVATIPMVGSVARPTIGIKYGFVISITLGNIPFSKTSSARPREIELGSVTLDTTRSGNILLTIEGQPVIYDVGFLPTINFGTSFGSIQATKSGVSDVEDDSITLGLTTLTLTKTLGSLDIEKRLGIRSKEVELYSPLEIGYLGPSAQSRSLDAYSFASYIGRNTQEPVDIYRTLNEISIPSMTLGSIQLTNA